MTCVAYALATLLKAGITLNTIPAIAVQYDLPYLGLYSTETPYVVYLKQTDRCDVVLHEFFHHHQYERSGRVRSKEDNASREHEAHVFTRNYR